MEVILLSTSFAVFIIFTIYGLVLLGIRYLITKRRR